MAGLTGNEVARSTGMDANEKKSGFRILATISARFRFG